MTNAVAEVSAAPKVLSDKLKKKLNHRLAVAKTQLMFYHPFVGSLVMQLPFRLTYDCPTMPGCRPTAATDGKQIFFHPDFMESLTDSELLFVVAHEVFHPMFEHMLRRQNRDPMVWNMAADYVINYHITTEGIGTMPSIGLYDVELYRKADGITENLYELLLKDPDTPRANPLDWCLDAPGSGGEDPAGTEELRQEWKVKLAGAAQVARMQGKLSAGLERLVGELVTPKVDWRDVLHRFVTKARTDQRTYARPNRRFSALDMVFPSISGEAMGELVVAVDCSGSVGADDLNQFASEVYTIQEDSKPVKLHVLYFDSKVCHYDVYERDEPATISPHGGGGTAFSPVTNYIAENNITPVACVFLTDLYCSDFGEPPEYPVLWVTYGADKAPWGEVVRM